MVAAVVMVAAVEDLAADIGADTAWADTAAIIPAAAWECIPIPAHPAWGPAERVDPPTRAIPVPARIRTAFMSTSRPASVASPVLVWRMGRRLGLGRLVALVRVRLVAQLLLPELLLRGSLCRRCLPRVCRCGRYRHALCGLQADGTQGRRLPRRRAHSRRRLGRPANPRAEHGVGGRGIGNGSSSNGGEDPFDFHGRAKTEFSQGEYRKATYFAAHATVNEPRDPKTHLLYSLGLFALGEYRGAAVESHAVMSLGKLPDWNTVYAFYGNVEPYTNQLSALEKYARGRPQSPEARFLLGFHYLMSGHADEAKDELLAALKLREIVWRPNC